jgi:hypothetical protein
MGNSRRWALRCAAICLLIFIPWAVADRQKIAIRANRLEHSLTGKITDCYGTEKEPVQIKYGTWELVGQYARWEEDAGVILVKGKVEVVQQGEERVFLSCQELRFWPQKEELEAKGSVVMERGELQATSGVARGDKRQVVLTELPSLTRGGDFIQGKKITVLFEPGEKIVVEEAQLEVEAREE